MKKSTLMVILLGMALTANLTSCSLSSMGMTAALPNDSAAAETDDTSSTAEETQKTESSAATAPEQTKSDKHIDASSSATVNGDNNAVSSEPISIDTSDIFSKRDLEQTADISDAQSIKVSDNDTISIDKAGVYLISGQQKCAFRYQSIYCGR